MKQALEMALEALKKGDYALVNAICEELKQAQPEQEPVAKKMTAHRAVYFMERFKHDEKLLGPNEQAALDFVISMLEAQPPQRKPLTDEDIAEFAERMEASDPTDSFWREFARAIEAAHGIKE